MEHLAKRLYLIREELKEKSREDFSREAVAERIGVNDKTLYYAEKTGSTNATTFKLISYYYTLGYNPAWIIIEENEFIPKRYLQNELQFAKEQNFYKDISELRSGVDALFDELTKRYKD